MLRSLLCLFLLGLLGCAAQGPEPIVIGSIGILSGEGASWGTAARNGIDLAVQDVNAAGGINGRPLVVIHEDDRGDPKQSLAAFRKLTANDGVGIIIGPTWSNTGLALADPAAENSVLMISPSLGKAEFNERSKYLFNTWPHDYVLSARLADYVYGKGHRRVGLISTKQVWVVEQTAAFTSRFEELGGQVVVLVEPLPEMKEVTAEALKIQNADIDAIVSTTDGMLVGALIAKRTRELGVDLPIYSITIDRDAIAAADGAYEGMEFLTSLTPSPSFEQRYVDAYGVNLDIGADSAYDAVMMVAQAMRGTNSTDTATLQEYLNNLAEYRGVSGVLSADGEGGFTKPFAIRKVEGGAIKRLSG